MTATPIPRTLALTVYGDLAVTEIAGRREPEADRHTLDPAGAIVGGVHALAAPASRRDGRRTSCVR